MPSQPNENSTTKVYFITGTGRGMGVESVRTALAAGYRIVATARRPKVVEQALGAAESLIDA